MTMRGSERVTFSGLLVGHRTARGMSQEDLAEASGLSVQAISLLERTSRRRPRLRTVRALADALGLIPEARRELELAARATAEPGGQRGAGRIDLPAPVSSIVGREYEVGVLSRVVRGAGDPLVTVTGPGGVGKSRLALEIAWRVAESFDQVHVVDASPMRDLDELVVALAAAVGCRPGGGASLVSVAARIGRARALLLVDGAEHVTDLAAGVSELLTRCPGLQLLVTSRTPLGLAEERRWPLEPLRLPPLPRRSPTTPGPAPAPGGTPASGAGPSPATGLDRIMAAPAMVLLVERAREVLPTFAVEAGNATAVVTLCRRLDGLPLAIELAAVQLGDHDPAALDAQLRERVTSLHAEAVDVPGRHRTLRATVEWSTERLLPRDRQVMAVLGAFRGTPTVAALRSVLEAAGLDVEDLDEAVTRLAEASLVTLTEDETRVGMLDTIREVAQDLLVTSGHEAPVRVAHARLMLGIVRTADPSRHELPASEDLVPVDLDLDNIRAALAWATGRAGEFRSTAEFRGTGEYRLTGGYGTTGGSWSGIGAGGFWTGAGGTEAGAGGGTGLGGVGGSRPASDDVRQLLDVALVTGLAQYYWVRGRFAECRRVLAAVSDVAPDPVAAALAAYWAGVGSLEHGDAEGAVALAERATALRPDLGRPDGRCSVLALVAAARRSLGDHDASLAAHRECLLVAEQVDSPRYVTIAVNNIGALLHDTGDFDLAEEYYRRSLGISEARRDERGTVIALLNLGEIAKDGCRFDDGHRLLTRAVSRSRKLREPYLLGLCLAMLAEAEVGRGREAEATAAAEEAVTVARQIEYPRITAQAEISLGDLALRAGDAAAAERHYQVAQEHTTRSVDLARILERLAAACADRDPELAGSRLAEADAMRRLRRYPITPADRPLVDDTRARLGIGDG
ncbi:MAG: tetratricopeptide repeat protein [Actinomycetales bacterium]|nr:tetratricopeptide repeat protein [Actinomycetales bacterium]